MEIVRENEVGKRKVLEVLEKGGVVVYPTETVYGLGVDVRNQEAVEKIWKFKGERGNKPILIAVASKQMMLKYIERDDLTDSFYEKYLPGPVSLVGKSKGEVVDKIVEEREGTIGVRVPNESWALEMIGSFGRAVSSTSVNLSGQKPICSVDEFRERIPEESQKLVDVFVDAGKLPMSLPSTVVRLVGGEVKVLRQGAVLI